MIPRFRPGYDIIRNFTIPEWAMEKQENRWRRLLKREVSRVIAWSVLALVLLFYPILLALVSSIALVHYLKPASRR